MTKVELTSLVIQVLTPLSVALVGFLLNKRLKSMDDAQWQNRKIVEKRLELYDHIAPELNRIFCFCMWLGYWKDISPRDLIETKRKLDKYVNIYRHLLSEEFYNSYDDFIHSVFSTYNGRGMDALIKSEIASGWGDRRTDANYDWIPEFEQLFLGDSLPTRTEINEKYLTTMSRLRDCIGLANA